MKKCSLIPFVVFCSVIAFFAHAQGHESVYPGVTWEKADPRGLGWSIQKLEEARQYLQTVPQGSVVVLHSRLQNTKRRSAWCCNRVLASITPLSPGPQR